MNKIFRTVNPAVSDLKIMCGLRTILRGYAGVNDLLSDPESRRIMKSVQAILQSSVRNGRSDHNNIMIVAWMPEDGGVSDLQLCLRTHLSQLNMKNCTQETCGPDEVNASDLEAEKNIADVIMRGCGWYYADGSGEISVAQVPSVGGRFIVACYGGCTEVNYVAVYSAVRALHDLGRVDPEKAFSGFVSELENVHGPIIRMLGIFADNAMRRLERAV